MQRRKFTSGVMSVAALGATAVGLGPATVAAAARVGDADAASGIRAALERGASVAVERLGRPDGFLGNPKVRIPLPGVLGDAAKLLRMTGQQRRVDDLVTAMNRAAESAVPQARTLLVNAARSMSISDATGILRGGDDSVTKFFAAKTRTPLHAQFLPIVTEATEKFDLAEKYNALASRASTVGLVGKDDANLQQYVTGKALDGLYLMIAEEERKIRSDPVATGSALLQKVFGR